ncbi:hypothetical protein EGT74_06550 [Chitinophaga lutea]|uniref:Uncharacterized protein n=2 Tax=Chitinophaga lutea TaxID=2488634 RepID=A0A3N4PZ84_9BACT|nr:hypothetical protein EGT74_06550 [Chitinophaga lutea]
MAVQNAQLYIHHPHGLPGKDLLQIELERYQQIYHHIRRQPATKTEKDTLKFVTFEINRIQAQRSGGALRRFWYSPLVATLRIWASRRTDLYNYHYNKINAVKTDIIQNHNLQTLSGALAGQGFAASMEGPLKKMISQGLDSFQLPYSDDNHKRATFLLHFDKIPGTTLYYFSSFEAIAKSSVQSLLAGGGQGPRLHFSCLDNVQISATQAAALLDGRPVCLHINQQDKWLTLDTGKVGTKFPFTQHAYDLDAYLQQLPLANGKSNQLPALREALRQGQSKTVALLIDGQIQKITIAVDITRQTLQLTDAEGKTHPFSFNQTTVSPVNLQHQQGHTRQDVTTQQKYKPELPQGPDIDQIIRNRAGRSR